MEKKVHNVAVTGLINEEFWFAKSSKFRSNEFCIPDEPKIIGSSCIEQNSYNELANELFREIEFNNCFIKASYVNSPYAIVLDDGGVGGIAAILLNSISYYLNFTIKYDIYYNSRNTNLTYATSLVLKNDYQFFLNPVSEILM